MAFLQSLDTNTIRLACFAGIFVAMAIAESLLPKRELTVGRARRWPTNWGFILLDSLLVRLVFPIGGVGLAMLAQERGWGLFGVLGANGFAAGLASFLVLDLAVWLQHLASHKVPVLWRIHKVHHADGDVDVTTALRFHPVEILLSFVWKGAVIVVLGGPVEAVLVFEIVLNGAALFNHANIALPSRLDALIRWVVVTPDMHRVHHSVRRAETDSNYGFNLSLWDRLFGTYTVHPQGGQLGMEIGLGPDLTPKAHRFGFSLMIPFLADRTRRADPEAPVQKKLSGK